MDCGTKTKANMFTKIKNLYRRFFDRRTMKKKRNSLFKAMDYYQQFVHKRSVNTGYGEIATGDSRYLINFLAPKEGRKPTIQIAAEVWGIINAMAEHGVKDGDEKNLRLVNALYAIETCMNVWLGKNGLRGVEVTYPVRVEVIPCDRYNEEHGHADGTYFFRFLFYRHTDTLSGNEIWMSGFQLKEK